MYPGPSDPDLGSFVAQLEHALRMRGHEIELAVLDRRGGGKLRYLELRRRIRAAAPHDVTWAHFLVPSGLLASEAGGPLVVTAHGRDVRNVGSIPGVARLTARVVERASATSGRRSPSGRSPRGCSMPSTRSMPPSTSSSATATRSR